jgi:hypothetical protein
MNHYFKDVQTLKSVDVYRVLVLFDVRSHPVGHAIKKLLCAGKRGYKDYAEDLRRAKASIERELAMIAEDEQGISMQDEINMLKQALNEVSDD